VRRSRRPRRHRRRPFLLQTAARTRPFTGDEYLESLRVDREIWIYGERVKDVPGTVPDLINASDSNVLLKNVLRQET
jgi:hypothetical protein